MNAPKLSVHVITYNHEAFIAQALDSVLMQETDFDFEIVIGEDCSTDRTGEIVREYAARHLDKIRLLPREMNLGGRKNWLDVYANCRGEYVALLDGDDHWTSPHKLQKQVELLDARRDLVSCFHPARVIDKNGCEVHINRPAEIKEVYGLDDLVRVNILPTASVVLRSNLLKPVPEALRTAPVGDWLIHSYCALKGGIGFIDEVMSVYRIHPGGVFFARRQDCIRNLVVNNEIRQIIAKEVGPPRNREFLREIQRQDYEIARLCLAEGRREEARKHADLCLGSDAGRLSFRDKARIYLRTRSRLVDSVARRVAGMRGSQRS